jgi:capsular polysaccharide biosynthesis protein
MGPPETTRSRNDTQIINARVTGQETKKCGRCAISINSEFDKSWDGNVSQESVPVCRTEFNGTESELFQMGKADGLDCEGKELGEK